MGLEDLPVLEKAPWNWPMKVNERAELTFDNGNSVLAYVAAKTEDGIIIYNTHAFRKGNDLFIEYPDHHKGYPQEFKYVTLRPIVSIVR